MNRLKNLVVPYGILIHLFRFGNIALITFLVFISSLFGAPSEKKENPVPPIHVDQLGYLPFNSKIALVSSPLGLPFQVRENQSNDVVFTGMLQLNMAQDQLSGEQVWAADFSPLNATGAFKVSVAGLGESYSFRIDSHLYSDLLRLSVKSFYHQRCGISHPEKYAGNWNHAACHLADKTITTASPTMETVRSATGGWHDGGDPEKYTISGVYAAAWLLLLQESYPQLFPDKSLNLPESGNGVPDLLDEARWEIEWLLRMQSDSGGVYHKLTALESEKPLSPAEDKSPRFVMPISTPATADFCALTAKAARLYHSYDSAFALQCLQAAQQAWNFLEAHPDVILYENPPEVKTKPYSDTDDTDERFWAALELYLSTADSRYQEIVMILAKKQIPLLASSGYWGNVMSTAAASLLLSKNSPADAKLRNEMLADLLSLAATLQERIKHSGYFLTLQTGEITWGSNAALLQNALILLLADRFHPQSEWVDSAMDQLHYVLGRNPLSTCYITGVGTRSPEFPHHPLSRFNKSKKPVPGFLVGGPNQNLNDGILKRWFTESSAPLTVYKDDADSYSSNEPAICWNAVLAYVIAALLR